MLRGTVKQVLSGDTVVVRGQAASGSAPERTISLAHVSAPRIGRKDEREEAGAWESREYLRKNLVGKPVSFKVEYTTAAGREYGVIMAGDVNVALMALRAGWVRPRDGKAPDEYADASAQAAQDAVGVFANPPRPLWNVQHTMQGEPRAFVDQYKGKAVDAVIERVRDGSTLQLLLLEPRQMVTLLISGIRAPVYRKDVPDQADLIEPFAVESRSFVETRLLQREVKVYLEGTNNKNLVGTVLHPAGNIAEILVREGLARVVDWSISLVTGGPKSLREAERHARDNRIRIWKDLPAPSTGPAAEKSGAPSVAGSKGSTFTARVVKINNGESIQVTMPDGSERRLQLASVRQPRAKEPREAPYQADAKEFLRSRLIGHKVSVTVQFIKPAEGDFDERTCVTVRIGDLEIGEALVSKGLATVVRYRQDDEARDSAYDNLLIAEDRAKKAKRGIHGDKAPEAPQRIADASENATKARQFLGFLKRAGRVGAVVEHVFSGSRVKLLVPRENCRLALVLGGIHVGRIARAAGDSNEPFAEEAFALLNSRLLQHDVEIEIENVDRIGSFIGTLYSKHDGNIATLLLENGFASVHEMSVDATGHGAEYRAAEARAKAARKGIWTNFDEEQRLREESQRAAADVAATANVASAKRHYVVVAGVSPTGTIFGQTIEGSKLEALMNEFADFHIENPNAAGSPTWSPRKGEIVSAKFSADGAWYRARVTRISGDQFDVSYVDYGNTETVRRSALRPMPPSFAALPHQAIEFKLAGVTLPTDRSESASDDDSYATIAYNWLVDSLTDARVYADVVAEADKVHIALIYDSKDDAGSGPAAANVSKSINAALLENGLATLERPKGRALPPWMAKLAAAQESAKSRRLNMWEYGDVSPDDDAEFGMGRRQVPRK